MPSLGLSTTKAGGIVSSYERDGLKLYMPYSSPKEVKFVGEGSLALDGSADYVKVDVAIGDLLFSWSGITVYRFIGRISNINTGSSTITLEEGSLTNILTSRDIYYFSGSNGNKNIALAKAIGTNSNLS